MTQITARLDSGTRVELTNGRHRWTADEPLDVGGEDTSPNPYELLLGSLAACTAITLALYCRHKGIELRAVEAMYEFDRVHAKDCEECEDPTAGRIERIKSHVTIDADVDDGQRARLGQIVSRCPVHKTLDNSPVMVDEVSFV